MFLRLVWYSLFESFLHVCSTCVSLHVLVFVSLLVNDLVSRPKYYFGRMAQSLIVWFRGSRMARTITCYILKRTMCLDYGLPRARMRSNIIKSIVSTMATSDETPEPDFDYDALLDWDAEYERLVARGEAANNEAVVDTAPIDWILGQEILVEEEDAENLVPERRPWRSLQHAPIVAWRCDGCNLGSRHHLRYPP